MTNPERENELRSRYVGFKNKLSDVVGGEPSNEQILELMREAEGELRRDTWELLCEQGDPTSDELLWVEENVPEYAGEARRLRIRKELEKKPDLSGIPL